MKTFNLLEIAIEVAWQLQDDYKEPRAESRWRIAQIALDIENAGIITDKSEDIDEIISEYLTERGLELKSDSVDLIGENAALRRQLISACNALMEKR